MLNTMREHVRRLRLLGGMAALGAAGLVAATIPGTAAVAAPSSPAARSAATALSAAPGCTSPSGAVSCTPASGTPQLVANGQVEQIRQLVRCGSMMFAVGTFSSISGGPASTRYTRNNAFSFLATAPYTVSRWNPDVNGEVDSIAVGGKNCSSAYLGGKFTQVHGTKVSNIAEVNASTGVVQTGFQHDANGAVETLLLHGSHLLAGGYFSAINGSDRKFYVGLSATKGGDTGYLRLNISGHYDFPGVDSNTTRVYNQQLSPSGSLVLAEGDFTSVGGKQRQQIFMLSLGASSGTVTAWTSGEFAEDCAATEPFYLQAASWSPNGQVIYIATTGYEQAGEPSSTSPRTGLCDAAAAFPATQASVRQLWINYTGCDSLYSTAADSSTAYFGGHERWSENPDGCDMAGAGAISAPGMEGLSPSNGLLTFNPTRGRGLGADDMIITSAGLWIAGDNAQGGTTCGGRRGDAGICLLPY